jgi:four helix bundle protein
MTRDEFKQRTKGYALRVIKVVDSLPSDTVSQTLGKQLLRAGTSVAANYRSAVRGRSRAEFAAKMGIVEEECDESILWMELLTESGRMESHRLKKLMDEGHEILAITVAAIKTARRGT